MSIASKMRKAIANLNYGIRYRLAPVVVQQRVVEHQVMGKLGTTVLEGPFKGLTLLAYSAPLSVVGKILGRYEAPLIPYIEALVGKPYKANVNVGCAEGYYAIGLARIFPEAMVYAYDIDPVRVNDTRHTAALNGVEDRVIVEEIITHDALNELIGEGPALLFIDCEGYELELLDPSKCPNLANADILVEVHDFINPVIGGTLKTRFAETHKLTQIPDTAPVLRHERLSFLKPYAQRAVLLDGRPDGMQWFQFEAIEQHT